MRSPIYMRRVLTVTATLSACIFFGVAPVQALGVYEFDSVLSLTGNCSTAAPDPVADPSCVGQPPAYPPAPDRPSGRFNEARAIAVDTYGNEYVASYAGGDDARGRIDIFDDEGRFVTEVAAPDAKSISVDSEGQLYVFEDDGQVVRYAPRSPYEPDAGVIDYEAFPVAVISEFFIGALTVDTETDNVYVVSQGVVKRLDSAANGNGVLETFSLEPPEVRPWTNAIAIDSQRRRLYISFCQNEVFDCGVMVLGADAPHPVLQELDGSNTPAGQFSALFGWLGLAVDEETGDFFVADIEPAKTVYQFDENYEYVSERPFSFFQANNSIQIAVSNGEGSSSGSCAYPTPAPPSGSACNRHYLFVPVLDSSGRALAFAPQNKKAPEITGVKASNIGETEAVLRATIAPNGADTDYVFEYTTEQRFEEDGFDGALVAGEGTIPGGGLATQVRALLTGLVPAGTYHFRVRAGNEIGEAEEDGQNEGAFTTYDDATGSQGCPNEALRVGSSALLPDCRAYELVTPPDTNGRPPKGVGFVGDLFPTVHSSPAGDVVSFKIEGGSLPGSSGVGSFEGDPYRALRTDSGWSSVLAGATGAEATVTIPASTSPDQGFSFWSARIEGPLVINGEETSYVRYPDGKSALIGRGSLGTDPKARGRLITEDGTHIVFETDNVTPTQAIQLEPNAPPTGTEAVYDRTSDEVTHVVSLLPGNLTPAASEDADYVGASKDGKGIAFAIGATLYLRVNNETTYEVGEEVDFAGVSEGGARIFYVEEGDFKAFDVASEEVIDFAATGDATPVNVASDGSRAYFISPSVLDGTNPEGDTAIAPASGQGTLGAKGTGTLAAATGKGALKKGNSDITGVTTEEGEFQAGMQISGTGIPAGTTIEAVEPGILTLSNPATQSGSSIPLTAGSARVTGVTTSQGEFQVGMKISGAGIPTDTTIEKVGPGTLTLSKPATQSGSTALAAGSTLITDVSTGEGVFRVGMNVTANGISNGTTITAIDETADTLTLSEEASPTDTQSLSAFAQNLYLSEEGENTFIATVTARDAEGEVPSFQTIPTDGLGLWTEVSSTPAKDPSRTNPDGSVFLFQSRANVTGYPESEFPQIYRYDAEAEVLQCISCIPAGTPASGGASLETYGFDSFDPPPFSPAGFVPNLTLNGKRIFFESTEALVSTDTDEVQDVYEWEANEVGSCTRPEGCVYLISSGQSARDNFLYAHSADGNDVFFTTGDVLTGHDGGATPSIYDARVNGGFPEPGNPKICVADGCRPDVVPAPPVPPFESSAQGQSGNLKPKTCPKGKRKVKKNGKVRCVKKKQKKHKGGKAKQRAGANRGRGK